MTSSLVASPTLSLISSPQRSTHSGAPNSYVLALAALDSLYAAAASAPAHTIDLFDKRTLSHIGTLSGHQGGTHALFSTPSLQDCIGGSTALVSAGMDGSVKVWDARTGTHAVQMTSSSRISNLLSCAVAPGGHAVAAGTELQGEDALIIYWDPRRPSTPLRTHGSTHSDDITTLAFAASAGAQHILSGSADGLLSISDAADDDEDSAVLQCANWGCSIARAGWAGPRLIWAASDMETFGTWSDELDPYLDIDIRAPSMHTGERTWVTDYLITCHVGHSNASAPSHLKLFAGSNEGDIVQLHNRNYLASTQRVAPWTLERGWERGHTGVVRALIWDEEMGVIVTGGEDAKINVWTCPAVEDEDEDAAMDVDSTPAKRRNVDGGDGWHTEKRARR